jgi:hypothetical protein
VVDWILPEGGIRRYAGLVVGLVLLGAMVGPVWSLFSGIRKSALEYPGSLRTPAMSAALSREEDADVAMVLGSLTGVEQAQISQRHGLVTVSLTVVPGAPKSIRTAAVDTVEEVMGVGNASVQVVELETASVRPARRHRSAHRG